MELRFAVWQFVRLMVHQEDHPNPKLDDWLEIWSRLDADLTRLAEEDMDAYSEMMMDQEIVMDDATKPQAAAANAGLKVVMASLEKEIENADPGKIQKEYLLSLKFERRELRQLTRQLDRLAD